MGALSFPWMRRAQSHVSGLFILDFVIIRVWHGYTVGRDFPHHTRICAVVQVVSHKTHGIFIINIIIYETTAISLSEKLNKLKKGGRKAVAAADAVAPRSRSRSPTLPPLHLPALIRVCLPGCVCRSAFARPWDVI